MEYLALLVLASASVVLGASFSCLLSCKIGHLPLFSLTGAASIFVAGLAVLQLGWDGALVATLVAVSGVLVGYVLATWRLLSMDRSRQLPQFIHERTSDPSGIAVVYFTHGESEEYDQLAWVHQFREFDDQDLPFIPFLARPFFFSMLRRDYIKAGRSRHRSIHSVMVGKVEESLAKSGLAGAKVHLSFLDDEPRPDVAAAEAYNEGASTIVVCKVFLTVSNHTAEGDDMVKALKLGDKGAKVLYTDPLWDSAPLRRSFVEKANAVVEPDQRASTGILLVGHGQPEEWDREFATETEQEIEFRQAVLREFEREGYHRDNLCLAWMGFREPNTTQVVRDMVARGLRRIVYFSAAISAESIHSQRDVPKLIARAKVPDDVEMINLGAWNDHPLVIEAIVQRIDQALRSADQGKG